MKRQKQIFLSLAFILAFAAYFVAPPSTQPGVYHIFLTFESPVTIGATEVINFTVTFSEEKATPLELHTFNYSGYYVNVYYSEYYVLSTASSIDFKVSLFWNNGTEIEVSAESISITIKDATGETVTVVRPSGKEGNMYTFSYHPLIHSNEALAILILIALLWFTEAVPLAASALLVPVLAVVFNILDPKTALSPFFHPVVALIFGGLMLGQALHRHQIDKRIALMILSKTKGSSSMLILVMMYTTAFLSFWISNTAAAAIMLPIGLAVLTKIGARSSESNYSKVIVLGIAYSATIGGIATIIGTPPNPLAAGFLSELLGVQITFVDWLLYGLPYTLIFIPVAWKMLFLVFKPEEGLEKEFEVLERHSREELEKLGPLTWKQKGVIGVFLVVVALWFTQKMPDFIVQTTGFKGHGISSGIVALIGVGGLYILGLLEEEDIKKVNWPAIMIIGGGIGLGEVMIRSGLSNWIASQLSILQGTNILVLNFLVGALSLIITMFASNTAAAAILVPIAIPLAISLGIDPILLTMTIAIAASLDFALPVGTPPSTLAYSTGLIRVKEMIKVGLVLDIISLLLLTFGVIWIWYFLGLITL